MLKLALGIIVTASVIGALMPTGQTPAAGSAPEVLIAETAANPIITTTSAEPGGIRLTRQQDGHFYIDSLVNGMPVRFLVDTGASMVALSVKDAQYAAVPVNPAQFEVVGRGASGEVRGQQVELSELTLDGKRISSIDAVVIEGGEQSLLGQSVLSR